MTTITASDTLFATLIIRGIKTLTIRLSGMSSYAELINTLRRYTDGRVCGLATLQLRNRTQGWCSTRPVLLGGAA